MSLDLWDSKLTNFSLASISARLSSNNRTTCAEKKAGDLSTGRPKWMALWHSLLLKQQKPCFSHGKHLQKRRNSWSIMGTLVEYLFPYATSMKAPSAEHGVKLTEECIHGTYMMCKPKNFKYHYLIPNWTFGSKHLYMNQTQTRPFGKLSKRLRSWTTSIYPLNKTYSEEFAITKSLTKSWSYKELGRGRKPIDNLWQKIWFISPQIAVKSKQTFATT